MTLRDDLHSEHKSSADRIHYLRCRAALSQTLHRRPEFHCFFVGSTPELRVDDKVLICENHKQLPELQSRQFERRSG